MNRIGFASQTEGPLSKGDLYAEVTPRDLVSFGLIPELVGRFPIITHVEPLDTKALEKILTEPKNALVRQYTAMLGMDGIELSFDHKALQNIAERAIQSGTGARALRGILDKVLLGIMYEAPLLASKGQKAIRITEKTVDKAFKKSA